MPDFGGFGSSGITRYPMIVLSFLNQFDLCPCRWHRVLSDIWCSRDTFSISGNVAHIGIRMATLTKKEGIELKISRHSVGKLIRDYLWGYREPGSEIWSQWVVDVVLSGNNQFSWRMGWCSETVSVARSAAGRHHVTYGTSASSSNYRNYQKYSSSRYSRAFSGKIFLSDFKSKGSLKFGRTVKDHKILHLLLILHFFKIN